MYVPADDDRKITKAAGTDADVVILDMEDAVADGRKGAARALVRDALRDLDFGRTRRFVRVNAVTTPHWRDDIATFADAVPDGLVLAKASAPASVAEVRSLLSQTCGAAATTVELVPIVTEDVAGYFAMEQTMTADAYVDAAMWGSEDLSSSIGAWRAKDDTGAFLDVFRHVRAAFLLTCARHGKRAIDTPFLTIGDLDGLARESADAAAMGFAGKQAIHPEQIDVINRSFVPPADVAAAARSLVDAFETGGAAVVRHGDEMSDAPHLRRARRILELVEGTP